MWQRRARLLPYLATLLAFTLMLIPLLSIWWSIAALPTYLAPISLNTMRIDQTAHSRHFLIFAPVGYATRKELENWLELAETRRAAILRYLNLADNDIVTDVFVDPTRRIYEGATFHTILVGDIKNGAGCVAHELLHTLEQGSNSFFDEGLAEHIEGKFGWGDCGYTTNRNRDAHLYSILRAGGEMIPLVNMMQTRLLSPDDPASFQRYEQAGSLVDFFVARYGITRFMEFYHASAFTNEDIDAAMQKFFGRSMNELENDWLASLRAGNFWQTLAYMLGSVGLLGMSVAVIRRGRAYLAAFVMGAVALLVWSLYWFYPLEFYGAVLLGIIVGLLLGIRFKRAGSIFILAMGLVSLAIWILPPFFRLVL